jgi:hypothetical protein
MSLFGDVSPIAFSAGVLSWAKAVAMQSNKRIQLASNKFRSGARREVPFIVIMLITSSSIEATID